MNGVRRLAAIMAADVVGYSRMMGADEEGTLVRLKSLRRRMIDPKIEEHHGRIVKTMGDGLLVEFQSVIDALRCADEFQRAMADAYASLPPERRIVFRIGIHQGDVVFEEDGDIFGDGVNIAARLEGIADPGGICVSSRVQEDAIGKLGLSFDDMGLQTLKNIARPVRAYRVRPAGRSTGGDERTVVGTRPSAERPVASSQPSVAAPAAGAAALRVGVVLGHTYRIEALIGRSALGEVYRAKHVELGTEHTIKLIPPALASDPKAVQLLVEEARKLGQVRHGAIVNYEGLFRDDQGLRYLVTEFVAGPSLTMILAARRLEPDEVLKLRDRLLEGLSAVHQHGIIHRDISPDNIIVPDGEVARAKLIDFGLATSAGVRDSTLIGANLAARHLYASPEQLGLFSGRVDSRSDIYSLGLVLAAAALGFGRTLEMGTTPGASIAARQKIPDLSALPATLRPAIAPLLEPRPEDRPASARSLVDGATSAPAAARETAASGGSPWGRGGWMIVAGAGAAVILVSALVILALIGTNPMATPAGEEMRARLAAATEGYACAAVSSSLAPNRSVRVSGHIATLEDLARLRGAVAAIPGIGSLDFTVELMRRPHCEVAGLLDPLTRGGGRDAPSLAFAPPANATYIGGKPALEMHAPGFDSFIYVDYFDSSGQVLHLFPNAHDKFNLRPLRNHFMLFKSGRWTICGNVGQQLITMVATAIGSKPLFPAQRPDVESAQPYIENLREVLGRIPQGQSAAALLFFDLHDAPPWINREATCPSG